MLDYGERAIAVVFEFEEPIGVIEWQASALQRHGLEMKGHQYDQNSRMEYEYALSRDSNSTLQCAKANPRRLAEVKKWTTLP